MNRFNKNINKKLFTWLFISFIIATIIGTVTHEFGHYLVAKFYGYDAYINYYSTWYKKSNHVITPLNNFYFTLGGPIETMLTGTTGLILIFLLRKTYHNASQLSFKQWFFIFLSLFWLRQTTNFIVWIAGYLLRGNFSKTSDEIKLAQYLHIHEWTITFVTAIIGAIVLAIIIFKFIPEKQRLTFIAAGFTGGIAGYIFWLVLFGKYIMP